jgi:hypothetical protein
MNHKQMVVANVQYKKPTLDDTKRQKGLLRYLTYRDGRTGHIKQQGGVERWHDLGLGRTLQEVAQRCEAYKSDHVLAFTLVFNANPELIHMVPVEQREAFICELTGQSLEKFFEARGIESGVEASYVLHHRNSENPQSPGLHDPHTHVILPGTYFDEGQGQRENLFFSRNRQENHIELLHRTTEGVMVNLMDRYVGLEWEQRFDALEAVREQQRGIMEAEPPHGFSVDEEGQEAPIWAGVRRTDENTSAAGYYARYLPNARQISDGADPDEAQVEFRPLISGLDHENAHGMVDIFKDYLAEYRTLQALEAFAQDVVKQHEMEIEDDEPEFVEREDDLSPTRDWSLDL